ncbi:hypothetical protein Ae406Ps2_4283 [Pseudonocardia sp. Ae406_Ps2]|nr:hypothetical protein Ae331Ps2_1675c [Pseudonocardia sp. Ae331_Ps2]OLM04283.1 hypothetical protein Ae406Ps2_4283 [Pseudonocardia sp. Ae406_Ps2]OLM10882.1 hypothetical protein Ae505Ps2_1005c [Pseudonocardia sp. Ae505_Ps2]OLM25844.1 hypothetical protein Ae706Ps2_4277 [Pseudonocardia sp. Ae706_Ps2]
MRVGRRVAHDRDPAPRRSCSWLTPLLVSGG